MRYREQRLYGRFLALLGRLAPEKRLGVWTPSPNTALVPSPSTSAHQAPAPRWGLGHVLWLHPHRRLAGQVLFPLPRDSRKRRPGEAQDCPQDIPSESGRPWAQSQADGAAGGPPGPRVASDLAPGFLCPPGLRRDIQRTLIPALRWGRQERAGQLPAAGTLSPQATWETEAKPHLATTSWMIQPGCLA